MYFPKTGKNTKEHCATTGDKNHFGTQHYTRKCISRNVYVRKTSVYVVSYGDYFKSLHTLESTLFL